MTDDHLPHLDLELFDRPCADKLASVPTVAHPPRILLLYGSNRERSFSRLLTFEAARLLQVMGAETRIFNPSGLPQVDDAPDSHPKVQELRELVLWSEGQVWCSPERHGAMTGVFKSQIDWIPLSMGAVRPSQGKTLALMQVSGGSQSFNALNQMRVPRALDAHVHHPQSVVSGQGVSRIRRRRSNETLGLLRPGGGRDGGVGQVHPVAAWAGGLPGGPLFRAQGVGRAAVETG